MDFFDHVISPDVLWSFLDTRHIKHGSDKKKIWRHLFLWCQLIYAQNLNYFFSEGANAWSDKVCSRNIDSPFGHNDDIECWAVYILAHIERSRLEGFQNR